MSHPAPATSKRSLFTATLVFFAALAVLLALGTWQLERKAWKRGLVEMLQARVDAAPVNLPATETWSRLDQGEMEFRRVTFPAEFLHDQEALVYAAASSFRPEVTPPGYWVFTPARLTGGSLVVVNRGFVPEGRQRADTRAEGQLPGVVDLVGALRWPEARGMFTPADQAGKNLWFLRDHEAIAAAKGWGAVAPFFIEQEAPVAPGGLPQAGRIQPNLPDNHLQYAVTWYGLALVLVVVFVVRLRSGRRDVAE